MISTFYLHRYNFEGEKLPTNIPSLYEMGTQPVRPTLFSSDVQSLAIIGLLVSILEKRNHKIHSGSDLKWMDGCILVKWVIKTICLNWLDAFGNLRIVTNIHENSKKITYFNALKKDNFPAHFIWPSVVRLLFNTSISICFCALCPFC